MFRLKIELYEYTLFTIYDSNFAKCEFLVTLY